MLEEEAELVVGAVGMRQVLPHCHQQHLYRRLYIYCLYLYFYRYNFSYTGGVFIFPVACVFQRTDTDVMIFMKLEKTNVSH